MPGHASVGAVARMSSGPRAVAAAVNSAYFSEVPGAFPDQKPLYDEFVDSTNAHLIPVDVNGDGLDDIIIHFWAFAYGAPSHAGPCKNRLKILVQHPGGTFVDETATRLIGVPDLGSCSGEFVVVDINADGRDDVALAASQEDGRDTANASYMDAQNAALVSQPDGRYAVEHFGPLGWNYGVRVAYDDASKPYLLFNVLSPTGSLHVSVRRNADGSWADVGAVAPSYVNSGASIFRPDSMVGPSTQLVYEGAWPNILDVGGAWRADNGAWQTVPDLPLNPFVGMANMDAWNGGVYQVSVLKFGDDYATAGGYIGNCRFRFSPGAPVIGVIRASSYLLPTAYTGPTQTYNESALVHLEELHAFHFQDGKLAEVALNIAGERSRGFNVAGMHGCGDLNGDGYDDLVTYPYSATGKPFVYINNKRGGMRYIGEAPFPTPSPEWSNSGMSLLHDFDHDGVVDDVACPCSGRTSLFNNDLTFRYYHGVAKLPDTSVPDKPVGADALAGIGSAVVRFSPPLDDGGLPLTGYLVRSIPAGGVDANAGSMRLDHAITGLVNGTSYKFAAFASNAMGESNPSWQTNAVTPLAQTLSIAQVATPEGNAGTSMATFTISLSSPTASPVTVDVNTADGSATAGSDYVARSVAGLTIPAGETSAQFQVTIDGDATVEGNEVFTVNLGNASGANIAVGQSRGVIINDDLAGLSIADARIVEGNAGQRTITFQVRLSEPLPSPVAFDVATTPGTATAGGDYLARTTVARVLDAGRTQAVFEVQVLGDNAIEADETFGVALGNVVGAVVDRAVAVGTIQDDDAPALTAAAAAGSRSVPQSRRQRRR